MLRFSIMVLLIASLQTSNAQDTSAGKALSLQQCIQIAHQNHLDIITANNNVSIAKQKLVQQKSTYLPQVLIENNAFTVGDEGVLNRSTTGTALTVSQNIYDGGLREANVDSAKYGVNQRKHASERVMQTVTYSVTKAYYEVLRAKRLAEVAQANVKYNTELKSQIESRAQLGDAAAVDVLPIEAQLAEAKVKLLSSNNSVRTSLISLQSAMGLSPAKEFDIQDAADTPLTDIPDIEKLLDTALKSRPDILQAEAAMDIARSGVKSAKILLMPRPAITASYSSSISGGYGQTGGQVVGGFSWDIFNGGANRAAFDEAKINQANAQEEVNQLKKDIAAQVEESILNVTDAKDRVQAAEISHKAARKNLDVQMEKYSQGLAITLDLLNAEAQLVSAQSSMVQARYDYHIAVSQLNYALGIDQVM